MKKLGFITDIKTTNNYPSSTPTITIAIWEPTYSKVLTLTINNFDSSCGYDLLHIIEYLDETNSIIPLTNKDLSLEEKEQLTKVFTVLMNDPKLQKVFLEQLDPLFSNNAPRKR